jgi:tetratricopeptide (TPR) repeat protein
MTAEITRNKNHEESERMNRCIIVLGCLAAVVLSRVSLAQNDQIFGRTGTPTRGLITKISPAQVTIQATGISRDFDTRDILRISFENEPGELRTVREQAAAGQYEDALETLRKIDVAAIENPNIRAEVGYYVAYCQSQVALTSGGDKAAAINQMMNFIRENPETYRYFEGVELLGDLHFAGGEFDQAARFYGLIGSRAPWPEYQMRAAVLQGRAQSEAGKHDEALTNFDRVLSSGLSTPAAVEQKMHATVGRAVCLAATGRAEEGIKIIQDLIAKNDPNDADVFGRAYNALGACYVQAGATKEALLAYLHTDVLYFTNSQAHAEALYQLAKLWDQVNRSDRAVRDRGLLQSRYPSSRWASMP